jgi:hypothetical protein
MHRIENVARGQRLRLAFGSRDVDRCLNQRNATCGRCKCICHEDKRARALCRCVCPRGQAGSRALQMHLSQRTSGLARLAEPSVPDDRWACEPCACTCPPGHPHEPTGQGGCKRCNRSCPVRRRWCSLSGCSCVEDEHAHKSGTPSRERNGSRCATAKRTRPRDDGRGLMRAGPHGGRECARTASTSCCSTHDPFGRHKGRP